MLVWSGCCDSVPLLISVCLSICLCHTHALWQKKQPTADIFWWLRKNIIRTALCWIVWHNVHSQQHTYMSSSYRSNRLGLSHWDLYTMRKGGCLELYGVTWCSGSGGIQAWCQRLTGLIVPEMAYNVLRGTLSNQPSSQLIFWHQIKEQFL